MATVTDVEFVINLHSKTPSWLQVYETIKTAIDAGEYQPEQRIPSLTQIIEQTGLAMATVQKAIRRLEQEHYVYTVSGRGTFVTARHSGLEDEPL